MFGRRHAGMPGRRMVRPARAGRPRRTVIRHRRVHDLGPELPQRKSLNDLRIHALAFECSPLGGTTPPHKGSTLDHLPPGYEVDTSSTASTPNAVFFEVVGTR